MVGNFACNVIVLPSLDLLVNDMHIISILSQLNYASDGCSFSSGSKGTVPTAEGSLLHLAPASNEFI